MTRASKASRTAERHREQVARLVALALTEDWSPVTRPLRVADLVPSILGGSHFDVAAVRAYGARLVAMERHAGVHSVVDDYRRSLGREPRRVYSFQPPRGASTKAAGRWIIVEPSGLPPDLAHDAMNWRAHVRLGRRLLAAIEGQPSECQRCIGLLAESPEGHVYRRGGTPSTSGVYYVHSLKCPCGRSENETIALKADCRACHGSGHNLAGTLPPVEVSPHRRCRARDTINAQNARPARHGPLPQRIADAYEAGRESGWTLRTELDAIDDRDRPLAWLAFVDRRVARGLPIGGVVPVQRIAARVVPRGQHRRVSSNPEGQSLDERINAKYWAPVGRSERDKSHLPRWRRGELRHSEQRRERERRRGAVTRTFAHVQGGESLAITIDRHTAQLIGWDVEEFDRGPLPRAGVD